MAYDHGLWMLVRGNALSLESSFDAVLLPSLVEPECRR